MAFVPSFYEHGLITRSAAIRSACAQLIFGPRGEGPEGTAWIRVQVGQRCRDWPADQVGEIVAAQLAQAIPAHVYEEARELLAWHAAAGHDVIIASSWGQEVVAPIGDPLSADAIIAAPMQVAAGRYTGSPSFTLTAKPKVSRIPEVAGESGDQRAACYACRASVTDVPMLEPVSHPHAVTPTASCSPAVGRWRRSPTARPVAQVAGGRPVARVAGGPETTVPGPSA